MALGIGFPHHHLSADVTVLLEEVAHASREALLVPAQGATR